MHVDDDRAKLVVVEGLPDVVGVDRQAARRTAVDFAAADGPEVARAEEGRDLVELVGAIEREGELEAGRRLDRSDARAGGIR